jgi:hemerythrin-like domain-containing protein
MPILVGDKPDCGFDDPLGLMSDCHRRIERFMAILETLAVRASTQTLGRDEKEAVSVVLRYFREAAPKHTQDEELSLFPRMRAHPEQAVRGILRRVEELERQHADAVVWHQEVETLGQRWIAQGILSEDDLERLRDLLAILRRLYQEHIHVEDAQVFPAARAILSRQELQEIGREMAARRGITA